MRLAHCNIQLGSRAENKSEAIRKVGQVLIDGGYIQPAYVESMLKREEVTSTFLGNGIAIPHGLAKDRRSILHTGIAVVQFSKGVAWRPGEMVYLVIGIAACSDEHLTILRNLTHILDDTHLVKRLSQTDDVEEILTCLNHPGDVSSSVSLPSKSLSDFKKFVDVKVQGRHGLHARPATVFVELAKQYRAVVQVQYENKVADGKSLMSLLKLGLGKDAMIRILAKGEDADEALTALKAAVQSGLEDEEDPDVSETCSNEAIEGWEPIADTTAIQGVCASPGLSIGPLYRLQKREVKFVAMAEDPNKEKKRLFDAIKFAQRELEQICREVKTRSSASNAAIFKAHIEFLNDTQMIQEALKYIRSNYSAGWSWQQVIKARIQEMSNLDDPVLSGRAADIDDVGARVLRHLSQVNSNKTFVPEIPVVLVSEDLTPSDTANLDPSTILGFCTAYGGPTSHTAIIARSLGIPAVVGAGPSLLKQKDGVQVILDGTRGTLYIEPSKADVEAAKSHQAVLKTQRSNEHRERFKPAFTLDSHRVEVAANIANIAEAEQAVRCGAEAIGMLRTEFLFMDRPSPPSEEDQYKAYRQMVKALGGLPSIIRTLDIGGDKDVPYFQMSKEDSSFMGIRGIRLCLAKPDIFKQQLRAIYRSAEHGPVRIMFPMISTLEELSAAIDMSDQVRLEIGASKVPIGIMIEVPSAVAMAEELAREVDFFSIGTNDLTQYTLAMNRLHPLLAKQADALHPAVLRMIDRTVQAANAAGIWVGCCGSLAADPQGATILIGLGITELSVNVSGVAAIKAHLRNINLSDAKLLAQKALSCRNAAAVHRLSSAY